MNSVTYKIYVTEQYKSEFGSVKLDFEGVSSGDTLPEAIEEAEAMARWRESLGYDVVSVRIVRIEETLVHSTEV